MRPLPWTGLRHSFFFIAFRTRKFPAMLPEKKRMWNFSSVHHEIQAISSQFYEQKSSKSACGSINASTTMDGTTASTGRNQKFVQEQ